MVKRHDQTRAGDLLHERDALGVVLALDLRVVRERRVGLRPAEEREARRVERDGVLAPAEVLDRDRVRDAGPVLRAHTRRGVRVDVRVRLRAVGRRREVHELGRDRVRDCHLRYPKCRCRPGCVGAENNGLVARRLRMLYTHGTPCSHAMHGHGVLWAHGGIVETLSQTALLS